MKFYRNRFLHPAACAFALALALTAASPTSAQTSVPRLEPAECPFERGDWARDARIECKWLVVSEDRRNPKSRTIKLAVMIFRARKPDGTPPLVFLHGGPGDSGITRFRQPAVLFSLGRDVVIYDQRGNGFSEPKLCPEFNDVVRKSQTLKTQKQVYNFRLAGVRKCVAALDTRIERSAYNTNASADDLIDLRHALGYSSWDIWAVSYGGRLAQEAMRRDAKAIRSTVLFRPVTRTPETYIEIALSAQRAFERVVEACNAQPQCHNAFPALERDFDEIYDDLNRNPLSIRLEQTPDTPPVVLDGKRFVDGIRDNVLMPGDPKNLARLPLLVNEFRRGDKERAGRILVGYNPGTLIVPDITITWLVNCNDDYGKQFTEKIKVINAKVRPAFQEDLVDEQDCKIWQKRSADNSAAEPIQSEIPTLILTGRYDDRTPTEQAKHIASGLARVYVYEFPNDAHGNAPTPCHRDIMLQFWASPYTTPDASCIKTIPPIRFITSWEQSSGGH